MSDDKDTDLDESLAAVQAGARELVRTTGVAKAQKKSRDKRKRKGGALHKGGAHWYALESFFDPKLIESTPIEDGGFMMGALEDWIVVEVKADWSPEKIQAIGDRLTAIGINALVIHEGIRFLRLRAITGGEEARLNEILEAQKAPAESSGADSPRDS